MEVYARGPSNLGSELSQFQVEVSTEVNRPSKRSIDSKFHVSQVYIELRMQRQRLFASNF